MYLFEKEIEGLYPKQEEFCLSKALTTLYGGAVGGGKSYILRLKLILLALEYDGIQILLLRSSLPEVITNHKMAMLQMLAPYGLAKFVGNPNNEMRFKNGSIIYFGYCSCDDDLLRYQGNQYEVIAIDEAGNFTFEWYRFLRTRNRLSGLIKLKDGQEMIRPRMYLSANPVGVGLRWLKRLFVSREYTDSEMLPYRKKVIEKGIKNGEYLFKIPDKYNGNFKEYMTKKEWDEMEVEAKELIEKDYYFIPASVYDNAYMVKNNPEYIQTLEQLPEKQKEALLYGSWESPEGQFFYDFEEDIHVIEPFEIPKEWRIYRARDYGLDMTAVIWAAMDENGDLVIYRTYGEERLIVSEMCQMVNAMTEKWEEIYLDLCPPDMWNKDRQTGKSAIEILPEYGQNPTKANNDRINGWLSVHEMLKCRKDKEGNMRPRLRIFNTCHELIEDLKVIQFDEKNPNDAAKMPHDVTHFPDALRYLCSSYTYAPENINDKEKETFSEAKYALGYYDEKEDDDNYGW